jgi:hypothetical protein
MRSQKESQNQTAHKSPCGLRMQSLHHAAINASDTAPGSLGFFHGRNDPLRVCDCRIRWSKDAIARLNLLRVNECLAVKAQL